jgi:putative ABC transport system permease protein
LFSLSTRNCDPERLVESVRRELQAPDPGQVIFNVKPLRQYLSDTTAQRRFNMVLLVISAVLALVLAAAGIYGVMSYSVRQRMQEIGIRMALGARPGDVLKMLLMQGMGLTVAGIVIGLAASLILTRVMSSLLFQVSAIDPVTFTSVVLFLTFVALLACYLPARRAMKVDPMIALRYE